MLKGNRILFLLFTALIGTLISVSGCIGVGEVDPDDDRSIERAVRAEVRDSPARGSGSVNVDVEDGVVTLSGVVNDAAGVGDIVLRAERIPGVKRVITEIEFDGSEEPMEREGPQPEEPVQR